MPMTNGWYSNTQLFGINGYTGSRKAGRATLLRRNQLPYHVRSVGRYDTCQRQPAAELKDILIGSVPPARRSFFPVRFPWLNMTQEEAVNKVLQAKDVAIVHGPPGTGKTTTLVEAIYETLHRRTKY